MANVVSVRSFFSRLLVAAAVSRPGRCSGPWGFVLSFFLFRAPFQETLTFGLRPRASHSCSRTGGTPKPEFSGAAIEAKNQILSTRVKKKKKEKQKKINPEPYRSHSALQTSHLSYTQSENQKVRKSSFCRRPPHVLQCGEKVKAVCIEQKCKKCFDGGVTSDMHCSRWC